MTEPGHINNPFHGQKVATSDEAPSTNSAAPLTESFQGLHQLDGELFPFGQLLQHLGDLVVSTANEAVTVDRLDHVSHVDDLDLVDDAAFPDSLKSNQSFSTP